MMNGFVMRTEMIFWHMELLFVRRNAGKGIGDRFLRISSLQADAHILSALLQP